MMVMGQFPIIILGGLLLFWMLPLTVESFVNVPKRSQAFRQVYSLCRKLPSTKTELAASVDISSPSPDEAANMGIRDWPQQLKTGTWEEQAGDGQTIVRYVLDGKGVVEISTDDQTGTKRTSVGPGSLVEVTGEASLSWKASSGEMIVLTPGFEEGGKLIGVAVAMIVLCGALVAGLGGSS